MFATQSIVWRVCRVDVCNYVAVVWLTALVYYIAIVTAPLADKQKLNLVIRSTVFFAIVEDANDAGGWLRLMLSMIAYDSFLLLFVASLFAGLLLEKSVRCCIEAVFFVTHQKFRFSVARQASMQRHLLYFSRGLLCIGFFKTSMLCLMLLWGLLMKFSRVEPWLLRCAIVVLEHQSDFRFSCKTNIFHYLTLIIVYQSCKFVEKSMHIYDVIVFEPGTALTDVSPHDL